MDITIMNNVCLKPREVDCPLCKGEGQYECCVVSGGERYEMMGCHYCKGRGKVLAPLHPERKTSYGMKPGLGWDGKNLKPLYPASPNVVRVKGHDDLVSKQLEEMTHTDLVFDNGVLVQAVGNGKQVRCSEVPVKTVDELGLCPAAPTASIPAKGLRNMWGLLGSKKQEPAEEPLGDLRIDNGVVSRKTKGWD